MQYTTQNLTPTAMYSLRARSCFEADVTACAHANLGQKAVAELLLTCKASSVKVEKEDERERSVHGTSTDGYQ